MTTFGGAGVLKRCEGGGYNTIQYSQPPFGYHGIMTMALERSDNTNRNTFSHRKKNSNGNYVLIPQPWQHPDLHHDQICMADILQAKAVESRANVNAFFYEFNPPLVIMESEPWFWTEIKIQTETITYM